MRVTYYDRFAECYKLKNEVSTNIIQRLGKIEDAIQEYKTVSELPFADNTVDMVSDRINDIVNAYENAQERF